MKKTHYNVDQCGGGEIKHSKIGNMPKEIKSNLHMVCFSGLEFAIT